MKRHLKKSRLVVPLPYMYAAHSKLRPSQEKTVNLVTNPLNAFRLCTINVCSLHPCDIRIQIAGRWMSNKPIDAKHLSGEVLPLPLTVRPDTVITILFHNKSQQTRKWNSVQIVLTGIELLRNRRLS